MISRVSLTDQLVIRIFGGKISIDILKLTELFPVNMASLASLSGILKENKSICGV